jgi:hypothetical protein
MADRTTVHNPESKNSWSLVAGRWPLIRSSGPVEIEGRPTVRSRPPMSG